MKTYAELITYPDFESRLNYLKLNGAVCEETFGCHRWLNQVLYKSKEWKSIRNSVIIRDNGCDLACDDVPIFGLVIVHHINPITKDDVINRNPIIFDMNNLVCVSKATHDAIHYNGHPPIVEFVERKPNDTIPWK